MIIIKDVKTLRGVLFGYDTQLVDIISFVCEEKKEVVITCGHREGDKGVHGTYPCRGIDIRSWMYINSESLADKINAKWTYDPERPDMMCAIIHDTGKGIHFHLQTHPNTILKDA